MVDDDGAGVPRRTANGSSSGSIAPAPPHRRGTGTGVGLGLALVAEHVRLHGGRVWVDDAPTGGARFVVELPRVELDEEDEQP